MHEDRADCEAPACNVELTYYAIVVNVRHLRWSRWSFAEAFGPPRISSQASDALSLAGLADRCGIAASESEYGARVLKPFDWDVRPHMRSTFVGMLGRSVSHTVLGVYVEVY